MSPANSTPSNPSSHPQSDSDPFDTLLTLEDTLYTSAYSSGQAAGARAGRIEGRLFGLESGFEKFAALGKLHGRSVVWGSRILTAPTTSSSSAAANGEVVETKGEEGLESGEKLPALKPSTRLTSNVTLLHSLTDPDTFSTDNTEEAVADFDDRVRRAGAKGKVIERIIGETSIEDEARKKGGAGTGNIEDFTAGKGVRSREGEM
jgi:hypothetical protein